MQTRHSLRHWAIFSKVFNHCLDVEISWTLFCSITKCLLRLTFQPLPASDDSVNEAVVLLAWTTPDPATLISLNSVVPLNDYEVLGTGPLLVNIYRMMWQSILTEIELEISGFILHIDDCLLTPDSISRKRHSFIVVGIICVRYGNVTEIPSSSGFVGSVGL